MSTDETKTEEVINQEGSQEKEIPIPVPEGGENTEGKEEGSEEEGKGEGEEKESVLDENEGKVHKSPQDEQKTSSPEAQNGDKEGDREKEEQERTRIKKELFIEAWAKNLGSVTDTCNDVKIDRKTYYKWIDKDKEFARRLVEQDTEIEGMVESQLFRLIRQGHAPSIRFYLRQRVGKYRNKIDVDLTVPEGIEIEFKNYRKKQDDETENPSE